MRETGNGRAGAGERKAEGIETWGPGKLFMDFVAEDFLPHARAEEPSSILLVETRCKALVWEFGDLPVSGITPERVGRFRQRSEGRCPVAVVDLYLDLLRRILDHAAARAIGQVGRCEEPAALPAR